MNIDNTQLNQSGFGYISIYFLSFFVFIILSKVYIKNMVWKPTFDTIVSAR